MAMTFQDYYGAGSSTNSTDDQIESSVAADPENQETRGQQDWAKKCVSQFSLYASVVGDKVSDPYEQLDSIEAGEYKPKLSKSAKKRLRKMKKKKAADIFKAKTAQMKRISRTVMLKRTRKDMKKVINQLSKMPL